MDLKRHIYHKGAPIGKDVKKLTKTENISFISKIFSPQEIELDNSEVKAFSRNNSKRFYSNSSLAMTCICLQDLSANTRVGEAEFP